MKQRSGYPPELRGRAVGLTLHQQAEHDSQRAAIISVSSKIGCALETLGNWVRQPERDLGRRAQIKRYPDFPGRQGPEVRQRVHRGPVAVAEMRVRLLERLRKLQRCPATDRCLDGVL